MLPGPIATEIWDQPDNVPALMDVDKVPRGGVRGRHRRRDRGRRLRVLHPAGVPRRHRRQGRSRSARRSTATSTSAAWPTSRRRGATRRGTPRPRRRLRSGGCELDRDPVEHRVARERVERGAVARMLVFAPACAVATCIREPARRGPSRAGCSRRRACTASVTSAGSTISPDGERTRTSAPSPTPSRAASSGWTCSVQRGLPFTSTWRLCIHELFERRSRRPTSTSGPPSRAAAGRARPAGARRRRRHASGASSILPRRRAQHLGEARLQRAEVDAVRVRLELRERQTVGIGAEAVAVRTGAQHEVEDALGTAPRRERLHQLVGVAAFDVRARARRPPSARARRRTKSSSASTSACAPWPADHAREPQHRCATPGPRPARARRAAASSSRRCGSRGCTARRRSGRGRAPGSGGRITFGVARRLVEVDVDAHHEVERRRARGRAGRSSASTPRGCRRCVTSARIWPSPGVSISSARHTTGSSPKNSGSPRTRDVRRPKRDAPPLARRAAGVAVAGRRLGEHRAAGPVEVAGAAR